MHWEAVSMVVMDLTCIFRWCLWWWLWERGWCQWWLWRSIGTSHNHQATAGKHAGRAHNHHPHHRHHVYGGPPVHSSSSRHASGRYHVALRCSPKPSVLLLIFSLTFARSTAELLIPSFAACFRISERGAEPPPSVRKSRSHSSASVWDSCGPCISARMTSMTEVADSSPSTKRETYDGP